MPGYFIVAPETISLILPPEAVTSQQPLQCVHTLEITQTLVTRSAALSGSLVGASDGETLLRSPVDEAAVLVVHLDNDTFAVDHLSLAQQGQLLIEGFDAAAAPTEAVRRQQRYGGWDAQVAPAMRRDLDLHLINERTLRLGLPHVAAYALAAPETIRLTLHGSLLTSRVPLLCTPPLVVRADPGAASLTGTLLAQPYEASVVAARRDARTPDRRFERAPNLIEKRTSLMFREGNIGYGGGQAIRLCVVRIVNGAVYGYTG